MGYLRFWRRIKIAPGLKLNVSKSGGSLSFGPRGAKYTVGPRGQRGTFGIPGTGLFYTSTSSSGSRKRTRTRKTGKPANPAVPARDHLTMGFFKRLVTPAGEEAFADGCRELLLGNEDAALRQLLSATDLTDACFIAGFLLMKHEKERAAIPLLEKAEQNHRKLGRYFNKYGLAVTLSLPVTDQIIVHLGPSLRGVLLALVEAYQIIGNWDKAYNCLQRLRKLEPGDVVILLSLIELLWEANYGNEKTCRYIVRLTKAINNETEVHSALLLYKARALIELKMYSAARDILSKTLRRKKNRPEVLMLALRYQRALAYKALGQMKRSRSDFERIYAENPDFQDVADRLMGQEEIDDNWAKEC